MTVYESIIEIALEDVFDEARTKNNKLIQKLRTLRETYPTAPNELRDERALLDLLWHRARQDDSVGKNGYVGSFQNCVFSLLYGVFGADVIAFLFNQAWVPHATIKPFRPDVFLERLSVLEHAIRKLKNGAKTPIRLKETTPYFQPGRGPAISSFSEQQHRFLLEQSLRELRDFGELGLSQRQQKKPLRVDIHILMPDGVDDPEILAIVREPQTH